MKRKIALLAFVAVCGFIAWLFVAPRVRVDLAARSHDPSKMKLNYIESMHKSAGSLPNSIQTGFIHLQDGSRVKFWFINKHVQPGKGLTRFDFEDGQTAYLSGAFCCEVWVSDDAVKNKESLQGVWFERSLDGGGVKNELDGLGGFARVDLEPAR